MSWARGAIDEAIAPRAFFCAIIKENLYAKEETPVECWAKKDEAGRVTKSLLHHCVDAGMMARALLDAAFRGGVGEQLASLFGGYAALNAVSFFAALHDLGKCHPAFQEGGMSYRHEIGTEEMLLRLMTDPAILGDHAWKWGEAALRMFSKALRLHHQHGTVGNTRMDARALPAYQAAQAELFAALRAVFSPDFGTVRQCGNWSAAGALVWGVTVLADWLASGMEAFSQIDEALPISEYAARARSAAFRAAEAAGLNAQDALPCGGYGALFPFLREDMLRPLQRACARLAEGWGGDAPGLVLIEGPMGEGKTEAALYLAAHLMRAFHKAGVYMGMPTAATSNSMYLRLKDMLHACGAGDPMLVHGQAWAVRAEMGEVSEARAWLHPSRRALLAQYGVGTVDQAMLGVMPVRAGVLRLLGLSSKVLVLDEVHAYDAYMQEIICRLLAWCAALGIPVVLLSATLPSALRKKLLCAYAPNANLEADAHYPRVTQVFADGRVALTPVEGTHMRRSVQVEQAAILGDPAAIAERACKEAERGGCVGVIVNTVDDAQRVYAALRKIAGCETLLFHARFELSRRLEIERRCIRLFGRGGERPQRAILVATQVVEQSIDIDLDLLLTAVCPVDLLLQRVGRMHRHEGTPRPAHLSAPRVVVMTPPSLSGERVAGAQVYEKVLIERTLRTLDGRETLRLPEDIAPLVEGVYDAAQIAACDAGQRKLMQDLLRSRNAMVAAYPDPYKDDFFMCEMDEMATYSDSDDAVAARVATRDGASGGRAVLLSPGESAPGAVSREQAQQWLKRTFPLPYGCRAPVDAASGKGVLFGVTFLPTQADGGTVLADGRRLWSDGMLGILYAEK